MDGGGVLNNPASRSRSKAYIIIAIYYIILYYTILYYLILYTVIYYNINLEEEGAEEKKRIYSNII